jgi:hypothetical protein
MCVEPSKIATGFADVFAGVMLLLILASIGVAMWNGYNDDSDNHGV